MELKVDNAAIVVALRPLHTYKKNKNREMERSSIGGGILCVGIIRLVIPKDFTLIVGVFWRGRQPSVEYTSPLLILLDDELILVLITQELRADTITLPSYIIKYFFNVFVVADGIGNSTH